MAVKEAKASLAALKEQRKALKNQIRAQAKVVFEEASKDLFENIPNLKAFSWTQYTPYFNDGEECTFSANTSDPQIQYGDDEELEDWYLKTEKQVADGTEEFTDWSGKKQTRTKFKYVKVKNTPEEIAKDQAYHAVTDFLSNFDDDELKMMFGDHVRVTVTAKGVEKDDYEHE